MYVAFQNVHSPNQEPSPWETHKYLTIPTSQFRC